MNIKDYIESGIIESVVLGFASKEEVEQLDIYAIQYPEIKAELDATRETLNKFAQSHSVNPPLHLKDKIWSAIENETPKAPKIIPINNNFYSFSKVLVAASVAIIFFSTAFNIYLYNKLLNVTEELVSLNKEKEYYANQFSIQKTSYQKIQNSLALMSNVSTVIVKLNGLEKSPESKAIVCWNKETKEVQINISALPKPPEDKQYQLWAIAAGKPVDAGVFEITDSSSFQKMLNISDAQAFAVTLERKGGSPVPSMEMMYLMGGI